MSQTSEFVGIVILYTNPVFHPSSISTNDVLASFFHDKYILLNFVAESFAAKNSPIASLFDGIGCGLGFTLGLTILGSAREILGAGSVFGITLLPETTNILMFILPPGAFLTLGYIIAIFNKVKK